MQAALALHRLRIQEPGLPEEIGRHAQEAMVLLLKLAESRPVSRQHPIFAAAVVYHASFFDDCNSGSSSDPRQFRASAEPWKRGVMGSVMQRAHAVGTDETWPFPSSMHAFNDIASHGETSGDGLRTPATALPEHSEMEDVIRAMNALRKMLSSSVEESSRDAGHAAAADGESASLFLRVMAAMVARGSGMM
jgi:hypothetical protein